MKTIDDLMEVYVSEDGEVCIAQRDMNEDCFLAFTPAQVDDLVRLLREKQAEAADYRADHHIEG